MVSRRTVNDHNPTATSASKLRQEMENVSGYWMLSGGELRS